jgi:HK97 family phage major capsid protein/HK97 family phage prohead protease
MNMVYKLAATPAADTRASNRAYSVFEIKSFDDEQRVLTGIASTPTPDRMEDIVEPHGAKFKLPLPLLWQHDSKQPIGHVTETKVTSAGIEITAQIARGVTAEIDKAWALIKAGLVRGLSIGFRPLEAEPIDAKDPWGGLRFKAWEWLELSAVTIPANAEANIMSIKKFDTGQPAELGQSPSGNAAPETSGHTRPTPERTKTMDAQTPLAEQIASFQRDRTAKQARLLNIIAETAGTTLDAQQKEEYDTIKLELVEIDEHLVRLGEAERLSKAVAKPVIESLAPPSPQARAITPRIEVRGTNLPKGTAFTRYAMALARSKGDLQNAASLARGWSDTPEVETVLKAAVAAGTTTDAVWAKPLVEYQSMANEFIDMLRPATIVGRMPGLRRVEFNIKIPRQTSGASAGWVGEGAPKPLSKLAFDAITMAAFKAAVIVVITEELARFSSPSAEALVRTDLIAAIAQFIDTQFLDPAKAAVVGTSPASITNGVAGQTPSGTSQDNALADLAKLVNLFSTANHNMTSMAWVMTPARAATLGLARNVMGVPEFPGIGADGGTLFGFPVITSTNIVAGSSGDRIFLIETSEILFADDGVMLDTSREASVQMNDAPDNPATATTVLISLWQNNLVGIRAERFVNWLPRRTGVVQWIENAAYLP